MKSIFYSYFAHNFEYLLIWGGSSAYRLLHFTSSNHQQQEANENEFPVSMKAKRMIPQINMIGAVRWTGDAIKMAFELLQLKHQ